MNKNESFVYVNQHSIALIKIYRHVHEKLATQILEHDLDADDDFEATMEYSAKKFVDVFRDESCVMFLSCIIKECIEEIKHHDESRTKGSFYEEFIKEISCV